MDVLPNTRAFWVRTSPSKVGEKATGRDPATARDVAAYRRRRAWKMISHAYMALPCYF